MCKTWSIKYSCNDTFTFRLSTCRGTFTTRPKPFREPKPMCSTGSHLTIHSPSRCGPCLRATAEEPILEKLSCLRARTASIDSETLKEPWQESIVDTDLTDALAEQLEVQYRLERVYPKPQLLKKLPVPQKRQRTALLGASGLTREVKLDEEKDKDEYAAWYEDWAAGWQLSEEAKLESERQCQAWMEADDEQIELEWSEHATDVIEDEQFSNMNNDPRPSERAGAVCIETTFELNSDGERESDPCLSIDTILKQADNTTFVQDYVDPSKAISQSTNLAVDNAAVLHDNKENIGPATQPKTKALPPHLHRCKSFILQPKPALDNNKKLEVEILERGRCSNYAWITVSS